MYINPKEIMGILYQLSALANAMADIRRQAEREAAAQT